MWFQDLFNYDFRRTEMCIIPYGTHTVDGTTDLRTLVEDVLIRTGRHCAVVEADGEVAGLVTPGEIRRLDRQGACWAS